jgi:hypothetical protein
MKILLFFAAFTLSAFTTNSSFKSEDNCHPPPLYEQINGSQGIVYMTMTEVGRDSTGYSECLAMVHEVIKGQAIPKLLKVKIDTHYLETQKTYTGILLLKKEKGNWVRADWLCATSFWELKNAKVVMDDKLFTIQDFKTGVPLFEKNYTALRKIKKQLPENLKFKTNQTYSFLANQMLTYNYLSNN